LAFIIRIDHDARASECQNQISVYPPIRDLNLRS